MYGWGVLEIFSLMRGLLQHRLLGATVVLVEFVKVKVPLQASALDVDGAVIQVLGRNGDLRAGRNFRENGTVADALEPGNKLVQSYVEPALVRISDKDLVIWRDVV